ncbi:TPA: hypothetical protein NJ211_004677 [Vibrio parahaemolyticus]|nr:hypothetical protein [Vibrio parahaemolyticus]HCG6702077.1 hypothetical protein [Vibrio parahaemolyticus]HCG6712591.1 hypothetical protein [Vibrio parahaemolyticus]
MRNLPVKKNRMKEAVLILAMSPLVGISQGALASDWVISDINLTFTDGKIERSTYANGRMQAPIVLAYKAVDPNTYQPVTVSPNEMRSRLTLWDKYEDKGLNAAEYSISYTDNGWNNQLPQSSRAMSATPSTPSEIYATDEPQENSASSYSSGWQYLTVYVAPYQVREKVICAKIYNGNGSTSLSCDDYQFSKSVTLNSIPPIRYQYSDLKLDRSGYTHGRDFEVQSFNLYISTKNGHNLVDFSLSTLDNGKFYYPITQSSNGRTAGYRILQRYYNKDKHCNVMATIWKPSTTESTVVRDVTDHNKGSNGAPLYGIPSDLRINQIAGSINISMYKNRWHNSQWRYYGFYNTDRDPILSVTDEFGNSSDIFRLKQYNEYSDFELSVP